MFWKSEFPVYFYCKDSSPPKNHGQQSMYWFEFILLSHIPFLLIVNAVISRFLLLKQFSMLKLIICFHFFIIRPYSCFLASSPPSEMNKTKLSWGILSISCSGLPLFLNMLRAVEDHCSYLEKQSSSFFPA